MDYKIKITFNKKGIRLTGKSTYEIKKTIPFEPDDRYIIKVINEEATMDLVDSYDVVTDWSGAKVGDYVYICFSETKKNGKSEWKEIHKITQIEDGKIFVDNKTDKCFSISDGLQISRKKKDIFYLEMPTEAELYQYKRKQKRYKLLDEVCYFFCPDWYDGACEPDELTKYSHLNDVTLEQLEEICELLKIHTHIDE